MRPLALHTALSATANHSTIYIPHSIRHPPRREGGREAQKCERLIPGDLTRQVFRRLVSSLRKQLVTYEDITVTTHCHTHTHTLCHTHTHTATHTRTHAHTHHTPHTQLVIRRHYSHPVSLMISRLLRTDHHQLVANVLLAPPPSPSSPTHSLRFSPPSAKPAQCDVHGIFHGHRSHSALMALSQAR